MALSMVAGMGFFAKPAGPKIPVDMLRKNREAEHVLAAHLHIHELTNTHGYVVSL